jgi:flavodoxin
VRKRRAFMSKRLVAYFSASGVTGSVARALSGAAGADLYEIRPAVPYSKADLDWKDMGSRSSVEMHNRSFRPPTADKDANIEAYDVIFLGFPIWWYVAPTIVNTFLESYDFAGKTIILFATSGVSGFGKALQGLKASVADSAAIKEGKILNGRQTAERLAPWVDSLGL